MSSIEWQTPQDFFSALNAEFNFNWDVAASVQNAKCKKFFTKKDDGLNQEWQPCWSIWMNPTYDKSIGQWLKKAYEASQNGADVVCLIQGRSCDTKWWHDYVMKASEIRFIKDRLHFGLNEKFARANISSLLVVFHRFCKGPPRVCSIDTKGRIL